MKFTIKQGMNQDILKQYPDNYFDSIVTDPPYGIDFLGKDWDANTGAIETWEECLRVLKPGGHLLAFSAARTYHRLASNIENVGFEIRDQIMWIYGSGFPKAQDIGKAIDKRLGKKDPNYGTDFQVITSNEGNSKGTPRCNVCNKTIGTWVKDCDQNNCGMKYEYQSEEARQWSGWKTALKPAHEPIVVARKPFKGSTIDNVLEHGVGALNIDATRIDWGPGEREKEQLWRERYMAKNVGGPTFQETDIHSQKKGGNVEDAPQGRYPSNVIGEISDYQKYFYCPKVSRKERHVGFDGIKGLFQIARDNGYNTQWDDKVKGHIVVDETGNKVPDSVLNSLAERNSGGNNHPTVKPVELMKYLIKLVTPPGGIVLDPFNGSGSTGMAAVELGHEYVGCELDPDYAKIAVNRIEAWYDKTRPTDTFGDIFE